MDILACLVHQVLFSILKLSNVKEQQMELRMEQMEVQDVQLQHHFGMVINVLLASYQSIGTTTHLFVKTVKLHNTMM